MRLHVLVLAALPLLSCGCNMKTGTEWVKELPEDETPNKAEGISLEGAEAPNAMGAEDFGDPRTHVTSTGTRASEGRSTKADAGILDGQDDTSWAMSPLRP